MEPQQQQTKLDPRNPADAVKILDIATQELSGPDATKRMYGVSVQVALETLARTVAPPPPAEAPPKAD